MRKRENDRIERENHAFAKRLFENHGSVPQVHNLEKEFLNNRELKQRVMRVKKTLPGLQLGKRATAVPPLEADPQALVDRANKSISGSINGGTKSKKHLGS